MRGLRDVVVTGIGVISPIGLNTTELLDRVRENRSGIGLWEAPEFGIRMPAGLIEKDFSSEFSKLEMPYLDRCSQLALVAARQAAEDGGVTQFGDYAERAGLFYGSARGGVKTEHESVRQFYGEQKFNIRPYSLMACMMNAPAAQISIRHQILGPVMTHSSACTSSGTAIGDAYRAIRDGYLDIAMAGGAESVFTAAFLASWSGLRALAEVDAEDVGRSCRPFSRDRTGLVLSEGAVFVLLESREHARARGAKTYCRVSGYGIASDGYHIGSPKCEGQVATLRAALDDAGMQPADVGYLNAHATATPGGDPVEMKSIATVFDGVPVSSTKAIHGHLLGAASAMELAISILAVRESFLPATAFLNEIDPMCMANHVACRPVMHHAVQHALSLSAGFGGTNVALIISREGEMSSKSSSAAS